MEGLKAHAAGVRVLGVVPSTRAGGAKSRTACVVSGLRALLPPRFAAARRCVRASAEVLPAGITGSIAFPASLPSACARSSAH